MTETEWLAATDPRALLDDACGWASERKLRLTACSFCRRVWHFLVDDRCRNAIRTAEHLVDDRATSEEFAHAARDIGWLVSTYSSWSARSATSAVYIATSGPPTSAKHVATDAAAAFGIGRSEEHSKQAGLVRDIFGNPFRPVAFDPKWRSETAVALAAAIYEERAFDRLPILADALEEAGCDNTDVLSHCRGDGPHARGCWVVDGVLGKE